MPHRRTREAKVRREARRYIVTHAYHDVIYAETVCLNSRIQVLQHLVTYFPDQEIRVSNVPDIEPGPGLVLTDSRGRGDFQK